MKSALSVLALCVALIALILALTPQSSTTQSSPKEDPLPLMTSLEERTKKTTELLKTELAELQEEINALKETVTELKNRLKSKKSASTNIETTGKKTDATETDAKEHQKTTDLLVNLDEKTKRRLLEELNRLQAEQRRKRMEEFARQREKEVLETLSDFAQRNNWDVTKEEQIRQILKEASEKMIELFRKAFEGGGPLRRGVFREMRRIAVEMRQKLLEVMTEEELQGLARELGGPLGRWLGRPPRPTQQSEPPPPPPNR